MSSFKQLNCCRRGEPIDDLRCRWCTCERCGYDLRDGFCLFCNSRDGNSFTYDSNPNSFENPLDFSYQPPQSQNRATIKTLVIIIIYKIYRVFHNNIFVVKTYPIDQSPPQEMNIQDMKDLKQHYLHEMDSLSNQIQIKDYHNEKIDIRFRRQYEDFNDELKVPPSIAITPILPTEDPEDSIIMGDEDLSTIPEKKLDEFIKSSVEDLVPIPSESEDTSESDSECDLPACADFSPIGIPEGKFVTFSNPLFNINDDFTLSDDESLSDEDVPEDNVKIYSNPLFEFDDEYISSDVNPFFEEVLEDIENKDPYDSDLDEPALLVTPLSYPNEDECFEPGGNIDDLMTEDKVFNPRDLEKFFSLTYVCPDCEDSRAHGFVHRPVNSDTIFVGCQKPGHLNQSRLGCAKKKVATWNEFESPDIILCGVSKAWSPKSVSAEMCREEDRYMGQSYLKNHNSRSETRSLERVTAAPIIPISSDSSDESVVDPLVPIVSVVLPVGVLDLVDYLSSSDFDPSEDFLPPVPDLPLVSPLGSSSHDTLAPSSKFPLAPIVASPGIRRRPATLIRPGETIPFGRLYRTYSNGPRKLLTTRKRFGPIPARRLAWRRRFIHPSLAKTPRCSKAYLRWRSALLSTMYPPTTSESSVEESSFESPAGPSRKRCRSPAAIVISPVRSARVLVPSHANLLPPHKRFRDSISLEDSVEEDINTDVSEDIEADTTTVEVAVDRDADAGIDADIGMEIDVGIDVEDEVESSDIGTIEFRVDMDAGINIPDGMLMPDTMERLEQNMTITRSGMTPKAIEELVNRCVEEALAAYEATCAENALDALTWWNSHKRTIGTETAFAMSLRELMKLMAEVYCPRKEVQKTLSELWKLTVKNSNLAAYTQRFQELTMLCTRMVPEEEDQI
nr:reverse transcriptase domain-containing protein [Tanacetum cinerariifolium]